MNDRPALVPTLDAIAGKPDLARELPRSALVDLAFRALRVQEALQVALVAAVPERARHEDDALLTVDEAAAMLGISKSTLEHGARTTYKGLRVEMPGRNLRFSRQRIQAWIRRHTVAS